MRTSTGQNEKRYLKTCKWCGQEFRCSRPDARFDTGACRKRWLRLQQAGVGFDVTFAKPPKDDPKPKKKAKTASNGKPKPKPKPKPAKGAWGNALPKKRRTQ